MSITFQNIVSRIANFCVNILMVGLLALFTIGGWAKLWAKGKSVSKEIKLNMIIPIALITVDILYTRIMQKNRLKG